MVLNIAGAFVAGFVLMFVVASIAHQTSMSGIPTFLSQTVVNSAVGYALLSVGFIGFPMAAVLALMPLGIRLIAYTWFYVQANKMLDGDYGDEAMWAAEIAKSGDTEFINATTQLGRAEMRELGVIADSKEELREIVIERAEEMS